MLSHSGKTIAKSKQLFNGVLRIWKFAASRATEIQMYNLCKEGEGIPVQLKISTSEELRSLFEHQMFVVAAVGRQE